MIVYKKIKQFSEATGEEIGTRKVFDYYICDYTGERLDEYENPNIYIVDYNSNDPCFGDGSGEGWMYKWMQENFDFDTYDLLGQDYIFKNKNEDWDEVFVDMIKAAIEELGDEFYTLDQALRWSRGQMLKKLFENKTIDPDLLIKD